VIEHPARQHLDVAVAQDDRQWDDEREVLRRTLVVVLHRQDGPRPVVHEHDLGRVVEHRLVATGHVEAAERARHARRQ
jgi:hypothetical protein